MKFRLPFQIYRTGVISRSNSPGKNLYKFSKDYEAKVRKKTSKINNSYRAIISNYIYNFTHLPLKVTLSKLRNRTKLRSSTKSHKPKIKNEFVFLQEALKNDSSHNRTRNVKVTNDTSECCMNSIKCANFMCAKSTAKILLQQKDLLCNKKSKKSMTSSPEEEKPNESKQPKSTLTKSTKVEKETKNTNNTAPSPAKKNKKSLEMPIKEKHKSNEYKWKLNKSEAVASSTELKRLKRFLQSVDENRNYKLEESAPAPVRMDSIMGTPYLPKKLPELPIQIMPKVEQVRPKEAPSLVAPKRKYAAPEMTRNYKLIENVHHDPPRMDNLVGCKTEPRDTKDKSTDTKVSHESYSFIPKQSANKGNTIGEEKDTFLFKRDEVVNDLMPKTKKPTWTIQQLHKANVNVSEKIKRFEELIGTTNPHVRSNKSQAINSRLIQEKLLTHSKKMEKILSPKLSPFAIAEIRRKYYPTDTFEKEKEKLSIPVKAVPVIEKNNIRADTKLKHLYSRPKEQYRNLDEHILDVNPSGNIKKKHAKIRNSIICHDGIVKQKDMLTIDIDNCNTDSFGDCSTCTTIETSSVNILNPKVLIPPPSKAATAPENKRNYSSTAIYEYTKAFNDYADLLNNPLNFIKTNLRAKSNLDDNVPPIESMFSTNIKKYGGINSEVSKAKKRHKMEPNNIQEDLDNLKHDRRCASDVFARNIDDRNDNTSELDKFCMSNPNSNMHHTSQRNLSKRHCTIKVTSTLDNQDNSVSLEDGPDKLTSKLSYQYYHEQCCISKNVNNYEMAAMDFSENKQNFATLVINSDNMINDRYEKMLNDKKTLINNYVNWKMQLHKLESPTKKCSKPSKCCLNFVNRIYKQNKNKMRKYKIIHGKQRKLSNDTLPIQQIHHVKDDSINSTVNLIKSQVAHKCVLFDKISDALLKKTDIISYTNQTNKEMQEKKERMKDLRYNNKRKLSRVPVLASPSKKKIIQVPETKKIIQATEAKKNLSVQEAKSVNPAPEATNFNPILEVKNVNPIPEAKNVNPTNVTQIQAAKNFIPIPEAKNVAPVSEAKNFIPIPEAKNVAPVLEAKNVIPVPDTRNFIEYMDVDIPPSPLEASASAPPTRVREEICNKRKTISQISSNRKISLQNTVKIKPPAIPATMKAKRFLAKIEAEPKQLENTLQKKIDKLIKRQKSTKLRSSDKIGKYISYV